MRTKMIDFHFVTWLMIIAALLAVQTQSAAARSRDRDSQSSYTPPATRSSSSTAPATEQRSDRSRTMVSGPRTPVSFRQDPSPVRSEPRVARESAPAPTRAAPVITRSPSPRDTPSSDNRQGFSETRHSSTPQSTHPITVFSGASSRNPSSDTAPAQRSSDDRERQARSFTRTTPSDSPSAPQTIIRASPAPTRQGPSGPEGIAPTQPSHHRESASPQQAPPRTVRQADVAPTRASSSPNSGQDLPTRRNARAHTGIERPDASPTPVRPPQPSPRTDTDTTAERLSRRAPAINLRTPTHSIREPYRQTASRTPTPQSPRPVTVQRPSPTRYPDERTAVYRAPLRTPLPTRRSPERRLPNRPSPRDHRTPWFYDPFAGRYVHHAFTPVCWGPVVYPASGFGLYWTSGSYGFSFATFTPNTPSYTCYYDSWHTGGWGYSRMYYGGWRRDWYGGFSYVYNPWPVYRTYYFYETEPTATRTEIVYVTQPATGVAPSTAIAAQQPLNATTATNAPGTLSETLPNTDDFSYGSEIAYDPDDFDLSLVFTSYAESLDAETIWSSYAQLDRIDADDDFSSDSP